MTRSVEAERSDVDPALCPLCGEANRCAMAAGQAVEACWCTRITIADATLARIPAERRGVACICRSCAGAQ